MDQPNLGGATAHVRRCVAVTTPAHRDMVIVAAEPLERDLHVWNRLHPRAIDVDYCLSPHRLPAENPVVDGVEVLCEAISDGFPVARVDRSAESRVYALGLGRSAHALIMCDGGIAVNEPTGKRPGLLAPRWGALALEDDDGNLSVGHAPVLLESRVLLEDPRPELPFLFGGCTPCANHAVLPTEVDLGSWVGLEVEPPCGRSVLPRVRRHHDEVVAVGHAGDDRRAGLPRLPPYRGDREYGLTACEKERALEPAATQAQHPRV